MWPTAATDGSVKITRGLIGPSELARARASRPRMTSAAIAALVLAHVGEEGAAVDVADRVQPVRAADAHPVVDLDRLAGLDPECLEARCRPCRRGVRWPRAARPRPGPRRSPARARTCFLAARDRGRLGRRGGPPRRAARRPSSTSFAANASSRPISRGSASTSATAAPSAAPGLRHLDADGAAAEHDAGARGSRRPSSPRGSSTAPPRPARRSAAAVALEPVATTTARRAPRARRRRRARVARPSRRACPRTSVDRRATPARAAWPESSRSWITSSRRASTRGTSSARRIELHAGDAVHLVEQVAGPQQRLGGHARVVGALAADQLALDDRHARGRPSPRRPAQTSPAGPAPMTTASSSLTPWDRPRAATARRGRRAARRAPR